MRSFFRYICLLILALALQTAHSQNFGYIPEWTPGRSSNDSIPIIRQSDPDQVTHTIKSGFITLGVNANGGGYINYCDWGDGINYVVPDYGKGWQSALRDFLHGGRHNPTQAGFRDPAGTAVEVIVDGNKITVPRYELPLFGNTQYDYTQYEDLYPDYGKYDDNDNSDKDFLPENGFSQEDEVRSEFDYGIIYEDASDSTFNNIPGFHVRFYFVWSRDPKAILQFNENSIMEDGNPVMIERFRISDISHMMYAAQTPQDDDYAAIVSGNLSMRFDREKFGCNYPMWRENGQWIIKDDVDQVPDLLKSMDDNISQYKSTGGREVFGDISDKNMDLPLVLMANEKSPQASRALGLYFPTKGVNEMPVAGIEKETGKVVYTEDRRLRHQFNYSFNQDLDYYMLQPIGRISGLLNPQHTPGNGIIEGIFTEMYILFGSPEEILKSAENYELRYINAQQSYMPDPAIPAKIEAENYDKGGKYVSYFDSDQGNSGGVYRSDDVDILGDTSVSNGYYVTGFDEFEWMEYTVDVPEDALYNLKFRVSSTSLNSFFHLRDELFQLGQHIRVPNTSTWDNFITVSLPNIFLKKGRTSLRIVTEMGGFNMDYFTIQSNNQTSVQFQETSSIKVYPNPFREEFCLQTGQSGYTLKVFDLSGRMMFEKGPMDKGVIHLGKDFLPGYYFLKLVHGENAYTIGVNKIE